jgi:signal transduction histidine kinase/DNA-binding response OmpR family regulator/ABC-type sugar transport system substrate-binding protein
MPSHKHNRPTIGVLAGWQAYTGTLDSFLGQVFRGIRSAARDRECNLLLACGVSLQPDRGGGGPAWPILSPGADFLPVGPWNTDGLIVVSPLTTEAGMRRLQDLLAHGHPVVFAGYGGPGPAVVVDNEGGIHQALQHLVEHGHRRIAFIAGRERPVDGDSVRRLAAYRSGLQEWGLELDPDLIASGSHSRTGGQRAMRQILDAGALFTAVLASNDASAEGAVAVLREAGLQVPGDVAVVGFDDRLEARALVPPLTTVHHPMFELGYQALALLLRYVDGQAAREEIVRVPTRLVVRESCGCLPGAPVAARPAESSPRAALSAPARATAARVVAGGPLAAQERATEQGRSTGLQTLRAMSAAVSAGMQRLSLDEVDSLCRQLIEGFESALEQGDVMVFSLAMQRILQRVSSSGDDLHAWQAAISILRDSLPAITGLWPSALTPQQVEAMLDQARVAISEVARGQYARRLLSQLDVAEQVGRMTARFLAARDEAQVYEVLADSLPGAGIERAAVCVYEPEGDDPVRWSVLRWTQGLQESERRFPSREFPPPGLYPEDRPYSLALLPLLIQDDAVGLVAFDAASLEPCADIARQLGAALRAALLYREAVEGRRLAEEANRLKSRFLSMVSHELRTPLNLIAGLSDILLQEGQANAEGRFQVRREDVERIYISAQHLDGLIRDVLDLAQSEAGQLKLVCEPLDLAEVLRPVAVIGEQLAGDRGLTWRCEIPDRLPQVWGDRTRLRQVALNLVNNAVKFTARGEIALLVTAEAGRIRVAVRDTGLGIPEEEQEVIFDEFRQSERTTARGYGGLGLGLAICKRLVEMHGGEIGVCSSGEEGRGSAFHFDLPVMERQLALGPGEVSLAQAQQVVLLVKDLEGGRLLAGHLAEHGFEVDVHPVDGTAGSLAWLLAGPPEAVVLDLGLASERGWEILKVLKEKPATRDVPVLFYTLAGDRDGGSVLELDYLTKPVETTALAGALASYGVGNTGANGRSAHSILLVDDEPQALEMYARIVQAQSPDHRILRAHDGREGLTLMRDERPDLVVLDLMMPEMDGFAVLDAMREEETSRNTPVIVLTGQALTQENMARLNRGVASVLGKDLFTVEETLQHIEAALDGRRKLGSDTQRAIRKAVAYLHAHYAEPISRADVASFVGVSERHLSRCFRQEMRVTLGTYLNRYRVRQAKRLLEAGDSNITQVAMEVGFATGGYFARVFRQEVGVTPSAYAQQESAARQPAVGVDRSSRV